MTSRRTASIGSPYPWLALSMLAVLPTTATAAGFDPANFSCRASALRAEGPVKAEPVVANGPATPCQSGTASLAQLSLSNIAASLLAAESRFTDPGKVNGSVASAFALTGGVRISDLLSKVIEAEVLVSEARVDVVSKKCQLKSFSFVGSATVAGINVNLVDGYQKVDIPTVGTVHLNATLKEKSKVTQRALWFQSATPLLKDVVVGESSASFRSGTSCGAGAGAPEKGLWMTGGGSILRSCPT